MPFPAFFNLVKFTLSIAMLTCRFVRDHGQMRIRLYMEL